MKPVSQAQSFGGIDADTDALLDQCFQDHEAYISAMNHERVFVLGRKGTGKTAIFKKIIGTRRHDLFTSGNTFADYPWHHHRLQEIVGVPPELRYVQSWPIYESYLEVLRTVGKAQFTRDEFEEACTKRKDLFRETAQPIEILRHLFDFSVVAYQRTGGVGGGAEYVWRHLDTRARFDEAAGNFRVHAGLLEALNLKKFTVRRAGQTAD